MPSRLRTGTLSVGCCCDRRSAVHGFRGLNRPTTTQQQGCGGTMSYVMVTHKVADYARWKPIFDADGANRQAGGSRGGQLLRSADDPNEVVILFEWDLEQARQYSQREALRAKMQEAGVLGPPEISFLEEIEQLSR